MSRDDLPRAGFPRIIATLGTTTDDPAVLAAMVAAGMGMARINSAYASLDELRQRVGLAHAAGVPVMLDLKGPQLRIECTTEKRDEHGNLTTVPCRYPVAQGEVICVGFEHGPVHFNSTFDLDPGDVVTFDNGTIRTRVIDPAARGFAPPENAVLLEVIDAGAGKLAPRVGANVPGRRLDVPQLSGRDLQTIALGVELHVGWYALSFVRDAADVLHLDAALRRAGDAAAGLTIKIEEQGGIDRLESIVEAARGTARPLAVMIARGDLFVELPWSRLPAIQADLLQRCRALGVPAIVATGLLLSMQHSPVPARSEVCDVAAAASADSFLLSDETSNSKFPVAAVRALAELIAVYGGRS